MSTLEPVPSFYKLRLRASEELKKWKRKEHEGGTTEEGRKREGRTTESGLWTSTPYDSELVVRIFVMEQETYGEEGTVLRAYMNSGKKITKKKKKVFDALQRGRQKTSKQNNNHPCSALFSVQEHSLWSSLSPPARPHVTAADMRFSLFSVSQNTVAARFQNINT